MKEHIIRAILYQDMSVKWKDAELNGDVNVHLNVHQKTRQFVEAELGDFILSDGEAILASFEKTIDGEIYHENPAKMDNVDGERRVFRLQIPTLVHNMPGEWGVQFFVVTDYDPITGNYAEAYPFDKAKFSEHSSFIDDGLTVPTSENLSALYAAATESETNAARSAEQAKDYADSAQQVLEELEETVGVAGGVAPLNESGKIPSTYLPSYVDDVVEYDKRTDFPEPGESGKIYVDTSTNDTYRWSGTDYIPVGGKDVTEELTEIKASLAEKADKTYVDELAVGVLTQEQVNSLF